MWCPPNDATDREHRSQCRLQRITHVVLSQLARPPAAHVEKTIVEREVDVGDERRYGLESLEQRWQIGGIGWLGGNLDHLARLPLARRLVMQPHPDRAREVFQAQ